MTQLALLDDGPGWYHVTGTYERPSGCGFGWMRWYESEAAALAAGERVAARREHMAGLSVELMAEAPLFARELGAAWLAAADGCSVEVTSRGVVRYPETVEVR